jgi:NADP-dependent 3-hydroxy acid dehydrogenase YdfG
MGALDGQVVIVTGASSGIGEATALACAREGAKVAIGARRGERLEALAERLRAQGAEAFALKADVGEESQARALIERTYDHFGRIDTLVNNAGLMLLGPIEGADTEEWRRMVAVNIFGVLYCTHAALPYMRSQGSGHIVAVSSVAGRVARAGAGVYNLTKFGIGAFCESLRQELAPAGIRVSLVEPGAVATELASHNRPEVLEQMARRFAGVTPLQSEDIAEAIVFAISRPANVALNELLIRPANQMG